MIYDLWFCSLKYITVPVICKLIEHFGTAESVYNADIFDFTNFGLQERQIASLQDKDLSKYEGLDNNFITCYDENYPEKLRVIANAPKKLFYKGNISLLNTKSIAIIGSRNADYMQLRVAENFARDIASEGITIISGLARGIDASSHKGALLSGKTIAVLGCGIDIVYPKENESLYGEIEEKGLIISEYMPSEEPISFNFPHRNRIIAGLAEGVFVVLCGERSGTLSTVNAARKENKKIWTLPVSINSVSGKGNIELMKSGVKTIFSSKDILDDIGINSEMNETSEQSSSLQETNDSILSVFDERPLNMDELAMLTNMEINKLNSELMMLELAGQIKRTAGKCYVRVV